MRPQNREKKQTKIEQSGMTEEELTRMQEELFKSATNKFNAGPQ
jgi:down-regulator of transcription 1